MAKPRRARRPRATRRPLEAAVAQALGTGSTLICLSLPAIGQNLASDAAEPDIKVLVTGSYIPAVERETGLPVQIITRDEIERTNLQTAAQLVNTISATTSYSAFNEAQGLNGGMGGFAGGALRGLGYQFTLVLLNGRRIANFAFAARGQDLNAIPLAAVERVEVLKDGASAMYGSDAVAGVINFILRKDYEGVDVYAQYSSPEHTGGYAKRLTASMGFGDLATQKFNAYMIVDYQKYGGVQARDRAFAARSYIPEEGVDRTQENTSFPANVLTPTGYRNPTGDPGNDYRNPSCALPLSAVASNEYKCGWFGDGSLSIVDPSERLGIAGSLTWQINSSHQFFLTPTWSRNQFTYVLGPTAVTLPNGDSNFFLAPTSAHYPQEFANAFGLDGSKLQVYWRAQELGPRTLKPTTEQWNVIAGMQGVVTGWRYNGAFNYSRSETENRYANGFVRRSVLMPILTSGIVNPFGPNTADVVDRMSAARVDDVLQTGVSTVTSFDFNASKDVLALPAGPVSVAVGFDVLQDKLVRVHDPVIADVFQPTSIRGMSASRSAWAVFTETRIPVLRNLDADIALRYDHYSDFGGTTNPKLSLRWQPVSPLVLRASAGTGFLAPGLPSIYGSATSGRTMPHKDPARCPWSPQDCNVQFETRGGGNPSLRPATSSQWGVGGMWAPTRGLTVGIDYVAILVDDRLNFFSSTQVFEGCPDGITGPTCYLIHRGIDATHPERPGPIAYIDQFVTNLGKKRVSAIDVGIQYVAPVQTWGQLKVNFTGTYNIDYMEQQPDGSYVDLSGTYSPSGGNPGVIPRWRHYLVLDWSLGPWSVTLTENYQTGTYDQSPAPNSALQQRKIGDYDIWNLGVNFAGFRNWSISAGIKNLLDRDPPFSVQRESAQVGYDPSYGDPHGRLYWVGARYAFR